MKYRLIISLLLTLVSLAWGRPSSAATITTSVLNGTTFCQTATVRVSFTVSGVLNSGNVFTAQLSDEFGSFAAPVAIGSLAGTAGGIILAALPAGVVTGSGYRVRVVASSPVTTGTDNGQDLTITNIGTVTAGSNSPLCVGGNLLLTASTVPGASYSWTGPNGFTSLLQNPTIANVGVNRSGTYTVTASSNGCSASSSVVVTVNALPTASVNPAATSICAGQSVTLNASGGTSYSWSPATGLSSSTVASPVASPTASTIYTVTVSNSAGCSSTAQVTVQVRATPTLTVSPGPTICAGSSTTLSVSGAQTYTWSPGTGLNNVHSATPIASPTTTTTYMVVGDNGGCSATATVTVTVEPLPTPSAGPDRVLCSGQSAQLGSAPVAGLTYSWSPSTGLSSTSSATPTVTLTNTGTTPRLTTYTLTAVSATGCVGSSTVRVTVNPVVSANAGAAQTFCSGGSAQLGTVGTTGYTYSWSPTTGLATPTTAQTTVTLTNTTSAAITTTYTLTASSNGCSSTSTVSVTVNPATSAAFAYPAASYCQSSANPTPTVSGTAGGTFTSSSGLSINAATGQIDLAASTAGTYSVTYSVGGPCPSTSTQQVTVATPGAAGFSYASAAYCASGANPTATLAVGAAPGTFTASPTGLSLNASTGALNLAASQPGTYTVTNTVAANGACQAASATTQVSVSAVPAAALAASGPTTICQGSPVLLTANGGGTGATYQFLLNGQPISGAVAATYAASQAGTYSVVVTNPGNCTATSAGTTITVNPVTTPTVAYGAASYCQNAGSNPGPTVSVAGGTFASTTGLSLNPGTGVINLAASQPGTYTVSYSAGSPCPGTGTASVTITAAPSAAFAYASSTLCASGGTATPTITGTAGGTFASAPGLSLNASTGAISLAASLPGTYPVTYTVSGACAAVASASVTITTAPVATFGYPATSYCAAAQGNVAPVFSGGASAGAFTSTPAGLSLDPATGVVNLAASQAGSYVVTNTIAASGTCTATSATASITISPAPVAALSAGGATTICQGSSVVLTAAGGGAGATYQFLLNNQAIAGATAGNYSASAAGSYAVVVTSAGGCSATSPATAVTVNPATSATFSYPATGYCLSSPLSTPSIAGTAGGTFASAPGLSLNASTGAISPAASTPGTYTVTYSVGGTCPSSSTATVTISAPASAAFSYGSATLCASAAAAPATLAPGASAGTFSSTAGLSLNAATGSINAVASTPGTYTVTNAVSSTSACGGTSATATVTINALPPRPTVSVQYNGPVATLTSSAPAGNQWYLNGTAIAGATSPTYVVSSAAQLGSYTVTTTSALGCTSLPSAPLVVTATARQLAGAALQLYPNPTPDGKLTVTLPGASQAVQLSVLNALGQVVYQVAVPASSAAAPPLDLSALPTGVYLLRATTTDGTATRRFVRE